MSPIVFTLVYFLCVVVCLAIATMLVWHLWGVSVGETAVESQDHEHYHKIATSRGEVCPYYRLFFESLLLFSQKFQNSYDLGFVLRLFKNHLP